MKLSCLALLLGLAAPQFAEAAPPQNPPAAATARPLAPNDGVLTYDIRDADTKEAIPCKLTFVGVSGTPVLQFTHNDIGRQEGDAVAAWNRLMSATGQGWVRLPIGNYEVWVSRGPEWTALHQTIKVTSVGKGAYLTGELRHVVDSRGWLSGDFHVHASSSPDSHVPMQDRVYEFVSDGVELIVSTDHNVVSDYAPIIHQLGLGRYLLSAAGDEMTTGSWGHFGAFPLARDMERAGQGAVLVHGKTAADFFADVRRVAPLAIIDVHHPRIDNEIGYFNLARFDAENDRADRPGFSYDFDALEVLNGYQDSERRSVGRVLDEWFAMIDHGHIVTATGNSDTHHLDHNIGGYPRNYVRVAEDDPGRAEIEEVASAIRGHHAFFTTAPFARFSVRSGTNSGSIGDTVKITGGQAIATIEVQAAPWVTTTTATIYLDGKVLSKLPIPAGTDVVRLKAEVPLVLLRDSYIVLRVDGDKPLAPIVGDRTRFDVRPLLVTNPVFLDVDGNGRFDAPLPFGAAALPNPPPSTIGPARPKPTPTSNSPKDPFNNRR